MTNLGRKKVVFPALALLVGCSEPVLGDWEADAACGDVILRFDEVEDDVIVGDGELCGCDFDVEGENLGDDAYAFTADVRDCGQGWSQFECTLDGDVLECHLDGEDVEFDRR